MSPKKEHEVDRMSAYISSLLNSRSRHKLEHVIDVGSGQGYLSRALQRLGLHILALDFNELQTSGAERWRAKATIRNARQVPRRNPAVSEDLTGGSTPHDPELTLASTVVNQTPEMKPTELPRTQKGSLTHKTIRITPQSLDLSIQDWLLADGPESATSIGTVQSKKDAAYPQADGSSKPIPVLFVALHACGSLTPDILRTFLSNHKASAEHGRPSWQAHGLVVVGCCYNLMAPHDFPLSSALCQRGASLSLASRHLAAQIPSQWSRSSASWRGAQLAIRKVVYRALLQPILQAVAARDRDFADETSRSRNTSTDAHAVDIEDKFRGVGETPENRRLGKLNDAAYNDWDTFLTRAGDKMGFRLEDLSHPLPGYLKDERQRKQLESGLGVLHVLRCLLGPLIESLILMDRYDWIHEELEESRPQAKEGVSTGTQTMRVELFNLFDQATGSGRNIAIVVTPTDTNK
ncbi:hypothetical protein BV22DRAFT_1104685 [Leucogyrophana mollusca]|uniref:Uncharacterized protein n=1 Tax=Leucogyrophana mollusca TaxID=85980 RepID=A0ACB8BM05_9AGAM|nr:hypothetical protein BV22DRAFT_1104685 [Leucogyrophana mollusca]